MGEPERCDLSEIRQLCNKYDIKICSILSWCLANIPGRDPAHPDPEQRGLANRYLKSCVDLAVNEGAPIVVVLPAPAGRTSPVENAVMEDQYIQSNQNQKEWKIAVE